MRPRTNGRMPNRRRQDLEPVDRRLTSQASDRRVSEGRVRDSATGAALFHLPAGHRETCDQQRYDSVHNDLCPRAYSSQGTNSEIDVKNTRADFRVSQRPRNERLLDTTTNEMSTWWRMTPGGPTD